jgi:3-isopropylmalate dehydratase small subunit
MLDEPLPTLEGRALCFGLVLHAEEILAPAHAHLHPRLARAHLFGDVDGALTARLASDDVIVAEEILGAPDAAAGALAALAASGVVAVVARRFAPGVTRAAQAEGIAALVVDTPGFLHTDDRVRLDLDAAKIVNLSSGDRAAIRNLGDEERVAMRLTLTRRRER